jgi:hypothetical protein
MVDGTGDVLLFDTTVIAWLSDSSEESSKESDGAV